MHSICNMPAPGNMSRIWSQVGLWTKLAEEMEFQLTYFKSWKMMLWKCCTQYASKSGKPSSDHRTGKGQFSSQSQRRAMPKNAQTTVQLQSFQTIARVCSKSFKPGFSSTWTENFQMYKLGFKEAEEPEVNCQHSLVHGESKGAPEKHLLLLLWIC